MALYADDTSIVITHTNNMNFKINLNQTFKDVNTWFNINFLTLNLSKTQYLEFRYKNDCNIATQIGYDQEIISSVTETKFLGLTIDDTLSWKQHIDMVINRLSSACYALRNIKYMVSFGTFKVNLLCSCTVHYELWYNLLGQLLLCQESVYFTKENY
jgi:hypothetical protein